MRNRSNSSAPKKARFRDFRADLTSSEVRVSSESVSMEPNKSRIDISSSFIQVERAVMRSSMTKWTPQSGHVLLSMGIKEPQAPHSPISSCATPENETPHFGHDFESKGIIALQVNTPHSAISTLSSEFTSSVVKPTPIEPLLGHDITVQSVT